MDLARHIADAVGNVRVENGCVVAITGEWGSGKTSLMNLAAGHLHAHENVEALVRFNPWMFSSSDDLTRSLVQEITAQLASRLERGRAELRDAVATLNAYSKRLSFLRSVPLPFVPEVYGAVDHVVKSANTLLDRPEPSVEEKRQAAITGLAKLQRRIVVLVDDIDRLTHPEIRDLFRAVRLTASFPNVVYVLCLDEHVVARALSTDGMDGQAYLEKILTLTCRVPHITRSQIDRLFIQGLDEVLHDAGLPEDVDTSWKPALEQVVFPLLDSLRDAKRVLASLPITLRVLGDGLPARDIVVLETVRILAPELHAAIAPCANALTHERATLQWLQQPGTPSKTDGTALAPLFDADTQHDGTLARALVWNLFPLARPLLSDKTRNTIHSPGAVGDGSVGTPAGLELYFTHLLPPGVATRSSIARIDTAWRTGEHMDDVLDDLPDERVADAFKRINVPAPDTITTATLEAGITALLRRAARLHGHTSGPFGAPTPETVRTPVGQAIEQIEPDELARYTLALTQDRTLPLAGLAQLVDLVTVHGDTRRITNNDADTIRTAFWNRLHTATPSELARMPHLVRTLHRYRPHDAPNDRPTVDALLDPTVAAHAIADAAAESWTTTDDTASVRYIPPTEILQDLYGGPQNLHDTTTIIAARIKAGHLQADQRLSDVLQQLTHPSDHDEPAAGPPLSDPRPQDAG